MPLSDKYVFTKLTNRNRIKRCEGFLLNRMQCPRAGEYSYQELGTDQLQDPPQVCAHHMKFIQAGLHEVVEAAPEEEQTELEKKTEEKPDGNTKSTQSTN